MIETIVTTQKTNLDISVTVPDDYVGKPLHVIIYSDDEPRSAVTNEIMKKKPSDFFGTLSKEDGEKLHEYVIKSRREWERNF